MHLDVYPKEKQRESTNLNPDSEPESPSDFKLGPAPDKANFPPIYPFAYRKFLELQVQMLGVHLTAEQAAKIVKFFPTQAFMRVAVFMCLFNSIVDFDKMPLIIDGVFTESERNEVSKWQRTHCSGKCAYGSFFFCRSFIASES